MINIIYYLDSLQLPYCNITPSRIMPIMMLPVTNDSVVIYSMDLDSGYYKQKNYDVSQSVKSIRYSLDFINGSRHKIHVIEHEFTSDVRFDGQVLFSVNNALFDMVLAADKLDGCFKSYPEIRIMEFL